MMSGLRQEGTRRRAVDALSCDDIVDVDDPQIQVGIVAHDGYLTNSGSVLIVTAIA